MTATGRPPRTPPRPRTHAHGPPAQPAHPALPWTGSGERAFATLCTGLLVLLVVSITVGVMIGPVEISPRVVWRVIGRNALGLPVEVDWSGAAESIVWRVRLPRVLLGAVVGAGLTVVGVVLQALVRNALADPFVLGVSSGASVGATSVILLGAFDALGPFALSGGAFLGALAAVATVFAIAQRSGQLTPLRLILSGVAMAYVFSALTSFLIFQSGDINAVREVLRWLLGSLASARWIELGLPTATLIAATGWLLVQARSLNALLMGDDTAATLGVEVAAFRRRVFVAASLLTGVIVAVSGAIGFVGLMLPHCVRLLVGPDHRRVLPVALLLGSSFMIWVDVGARTVKAPQELPIGILTALLGAPFFVTLMRSDRHGLRGA